MKKISITVLLFITTAAAFAQTTLKADPYHSKLGFTITHLGITDITGFFDKFETSITATKSDFSDAVVTMTADVNSINTAVAPRDNHLKSADFFDVAKYPTMTFKSTSVKKSGSNTFKLTGDLTLHGITKPVVLDVTYRGSAKNPAANNAEVAGIQLRGVIRRSDFGIGTKFPAPMLSDEVTIKADGEFAPSK